MLKAYEELRTKAISAMTERKVSQRGIARQTGLSKTTVGGFISGKTKPYRGTVVRVCDFLGIDWRGN